MEMIKIPDLTGRTNEEDRLELGTLLLKMGYTVHCGKEKVGTRSTYRHYIEYSGSEATK